MEKIFLDIAILLGLFSIPPIIFWSAYKWREQEFDKKHPAITYDYDPKNWDRYNP